MRPHHIILLLASLNDEEEIPVARRPGLTTRGSQLLADIKQEREDSQKVVLKVSGRIGHHVDVVRLHLAHGPPLVYESDGPGGAKEVGPFSIDPSDPIVAVEQKDIEEFLGNELVFELKSGKRLPISGEQCRRRRYQSVRHAARKGERVVGLKFNKDGSLVGIESQPI